MQEYPFKIAKNSGIIIANYVFDAVCNLIITILLAKYFGQAGFGKLSFLTAFFFFLGSADNQWIRPILVREMSRDAANCGRIAGNGLVIRSALSLLIILIFWTAVWSVNPSPEIIALSWFVSLSLLISSLVSSYGTIFQVSLKMGYFLGANILSKILTLALIYTIIVYRGTLFQFYLLSILPGIVMLLLVRHYAGRIIAPCFRIDFALWKKIFKDAWPLGLTVFFIFIYHRLDQILIFRFKGADALGLYSAAVRLTESLNIVPVALMTTVLPLLAKYHESRRDAFERTYTLSIKYLLMFIIPTAFVVSLFSKQILRLFYGQEFLASSPALGILIWAEVFVFLGIVNNSILTAANKQKIDPLFTGVSALANAGLNFLLIPKYGFVGAAVASLVAYSAGPIMGYFIRSTREYSYRMFLYSIKPLLACLAMAGVFYCTRSSFWVSVLVLPPVYLLAMYSVKGLSRDDIAIFRSLLGQKIQG